MIGKVAATVAVLVIWAAAIWGAYEWTLDHSRWEVLNGGIAAVFGLAIAVPVLGRLWRGPRPPLD